MLGKSKIKYIQTLGQKKFREEEGLFVAEGPKIIKELLANIPKRIKQIYALKEWIDENEQLTGDIPLLEVSEIELEKLSQLSKPNKVIAVVLQLSIAVSDAKKNQVTIVLDDIQDPGNLGSIVRIADWYGVEQIICSSHSADVYNPKVVQATMGSIARVNVFYTELDSWLQNQNDIRVYASTLTGKDIRNVQRVNECILIIGNESKGIDPSILRFAQEMITIPGSGKVNSLNAAVATGIILSHLKL